MMSDGPKKFSFTPMVVVAFIAVGASAIYADSLGKFDRTPAQIAKELSIFKKCQIFSTPVSNGFTSYDAKVLYCDLSDSQKSTPEALDKAIEMRDSLAKEVFNLHPTHKNQLESRLNFINEKGLTVESDSSDIADKIQSIREKSTSDSPKNNNKNGI